MRGKTTCETLKAIRKQVADANGIPYEPHICTYKGPCSGTCPACEAEARYIEAELAKRQKAKQPVKIVGVAKDKMPEPSSFIQTVAAAASISAVLTFSTLPVAAVAQNVEEVNTEATNFINVDEFAQSIKNSDTLLYIINLKQIVEVDDDTPIDSINTKDIEKIQVVRKSDNPLFLIDGMPMGGDIKQNLETIHGLNISNIEILRLNQNPQYIFGYSSAKVAVCIKTVEE